MNGNALIRILATFGLLVASLWVSFDIFTSGSNAVARFYMYAMVAAGVYGLLNARKAFFILLFLTAYLDFFKRFMIFDSGVSKMDLYFVLGIAPAAMSGITGNILYQYFTGKLPGRPGLTKLIVVTLAITALAGLLSLTGGGDSFRSLGDTVNAIIYIMLIFAVPVLFRTPEDIRHMLKTLVIIFVPSVAYMIAHWWHGGIFDWEMDYVKSGLTIEIRQLSERVFRPFGTLNSASNASMIFSVIMALCFAGFWNARSAAGKAQPFLFRWAFIPCIAIAMGATYSRTGWILALVAVLAMPMLKRKNLTLAGYGIAFATIVAVILASPYLIKHKILNEISGEIYEQKRTNEWAQATNLATLNDRLEGYHGLVTNPDAWTPFGLRWGSKSENVVRSKMGNHDKFTDILLNYGFVTVLVGFAFIAIQMSKLHRFVVHEKDKLARNLGAACLAIGLSLTSGGLVNGAQFLTYPVNFYIWFTFSVVVSLRLWGIERDKELGILPASDEPLMQRSQMRVAPSRTIATPVPAAARG